jgi:hypothetical protein
VNAIQLSQAVDIWDNPGSEHYSTFSSSRRVEIVVNTIQLSQAVDTNQLSQAVDKWNNSE